MGQTVPRERGPGKRVIVFPRARFKDLVVLKLQ